MKYIYIEVVLQEERLFHLNTNFFYKKEKGKTKSTKTLHGLHLCGRIRPIDAKRNQHGLWVQLLASFFVSLKNTLYNITVFSTWQCYQAFLRRTNKKDLTKQKYPVCLGTPFLNGQTGTLVNRKNSSLKSSVF